MFNKKLLMNRRVFQTVTAPKYPQTYDYGFSIIANMEYGSKRYYLPSQGMLEMHEDWKRNALCKKKQFYMDRYALFKDFFYFLSMLFWKTSIKPTFSN